MRELMRGAPYTALPLLVVVALVGPGCGEATDDDAAQGSPDAGAGRDGDDDGRPPRGDDDDGTEGSGDDDDSANDDDSPDPNRADDDGANGDDDATPGPAADDTSEPFTPVMSSGGNVTRLARLSHTQYHNTVNDLLGIEDAPGAAFAPDALNGFDFDTSVDYPVDARLGPQYRAAAEELGDRVAGDTELALSLVPCDAAENDCAARFVASFGQRAFRRPLTSDEQSRFEALFAEGVNVVASGDAFVDGVALVVEAALQSPQFLYRVELSEDADAEGNIPLDGWELASRLSYFLWDSMPDEELFDAAANGLLTDPNQLAAQIDRMLDEAPVLDKLVRFHEQAWQFGKLSRIAPDADFYPALPDDLGGRAAEAGRWFVSSVMQDGGGFRELMSAPYAFADEGLAPLYGQEVNGGFTRIELDPAERQGFLMQIGFLAANAHAVKTDPIHRGLFVARNLLCQAVPDPDADFTQLGLPETDTPPRTTREEVALLTGTNENPDPMRQEVCGACHALINPAGFAFENFDAIGQLRQQENDVDVDTTGELFVDGERRAFTSGVELAALVAASAEGPACYASKLANFAFGYEPGAELDLGALADAGGTLDQARSIALSAAFQRRAANEVAP